jgi:hypothetical protein
MEKLETTQQTLDIFTPSLKKRSRRRNNSAKEKHRLLIRKLNEVIYGRRVMLKVYSKILQKHFWIINEELIDVKENSFDCEVITMEKLAELLYKGTGAHI